MGLNLNGGPCRLPASARPNVFALVIYIPDPLGSFLDNLRRELVPSYNPHAHVSVLPPRCLCGDWMRAAEEVRTLTESWPPFEIQLTEVGTFPSTDVLYLEIGAAGASELRRMHAAMNGCPSLAYAEPFDYHPHITLAQDVPRLSVPPLREYAVRRWNEFRGSRTFRAERAVFVQNTDENVWVDLAGYSLGSALAIR